MLSHDADVDRFGKVLLPNPGQQGHSKTNMEGTERSTGRGGLTSLMSSMQLRVASRWYGPVQTTPSATSHARQVSEEPQPKPMQKSTQRNSAIASSPPSSPPTAPPCPPASHDILAFGGSAQPEDSS